MRTDTVFKRAFNGALDLLAGDGPDQLSESGLARALGVSRTTIRKVLDELFARNLVERGPGTAALRRGRAVSPGDRFPEAETTARGLQVERLFMEWMLREDARPGTLIAERDLARRFGVSTGGVREFLLRFSRFGLIEKKPNSGWLVRGFTEEFALELFEVRQLFELRSARLFGALPGTSPLWARLQALREEHVALRAVIDTRFHDFSSLDSRFHLLLHEAAPNRFIEDFQGLIGLIFHYHYQWNKVSERERNLAAIGEHLDLIDALLGRDQARIEVACRAHLASARRTLLRSLVGAT